MRTMNLNDKANAGSSQQLSIGREAAARNRRYASAYMPTSDKTRLFALAGDAAPGDLVTEVAPSDVARVAAALICGLDAPDRRAALRQITSLVSGCPTQLPQVPVAALVPDDASVPQVNCLLNGLFMLLLSLGTASADTSVGTVVANAAAMASGAPFASDPLNAERQNEVVLAKAILEAALLGDEDAKKWFSDMGLSDALGRIAREAQSGVSDQVPIPRTVEERLVEVYDCMEHEMPLGGTPLKGGFLSDMWQGVKQALGDALIKSASPKTGTSQSEMSGGDSHQSPEASSAAGAADLKSAMDGEVSQVREALDQAKEQLSAGQERVSNYKDELKKSALQAARLQWASALLDVPDDVATILSGATPNMADVSTFLQSVLSLLPAARDSGNVSTLKSLLYAVRAAAGSAGSGSLYDLLQGDPQAVHADAGMEYPWWSAIQAARDRQASVAGAVLDTIGDQAPVTAGDDAGAATVLPAKAPDTELTLDREASSIEGEDGEAGEEGVVI